MPEIAARTHHGGVIDESFDDLMTMMDGPVFVVTTQTGGRPSGCLVAFATQTSVHPPSFMVGLPLASNLHAAARESEYLAVHMLPRRHKVLAEMFGNHSDDGDVHNGNVFAHCSWRAGPLGMPILDDAAAWFVGRTLSRSDVADHVAYLLEPVAVWAPENAEEVLYLSDIDEFEPGQEAPQKLYTGERAAAATRYGMRFTLDVP